MRLPLFPLHTVLFPEATLALQIFEPRYREMIGRCLAHDEPFGVVLILDGEEVGGPAVPRKVGTEAAILDDLRRWFDARWNDRRASRKLTPALITRLLADPTVVVLPEAAIPPPPRKGTGPARGRVHPRSLSYHVAASLPATDDVRQELLEILDVASRLRREAELLMSIHRIGVEAGAA